MMANGEGRRVTAMATLRNRFFVEGILLGGICGIVLGSLIAFQVGNERVIEARRRMERVVRREPTIEYEHIRQ
ncbi:MAG: hypothetical protein ACXWP0_07590 [Ktedonobacterales bacterium]|jgi:hypothetical protein